MIVAIPIIGGVCLLVGAFVRQVIFKSTETQSTFGNNTKSIIVGLIFVVIAGLVFKGCDKNIDNNNTIDYDGK